VKFAANFNGTLISIAYLHSQNRISEHAGGFKCNNHFAIVLAIAMLLDG